LSEKLKGVQLESAAELVMKLQEDLKMKEKQYDLLRGKQRSDQEGRKIAEEQLDVLKKELQSKEDESKAKDKHIRQLNKKIKEMKKDWISNREPATVTEGISSSPTPNSPRSWERSPDHREIKQLKEEIWAHQNQNAALAKEVARLEMENKLTVKVKDESMRLTEKELAHTKQLFQDLREKYLAQQVGLLASTDDSIGVELAKIKKEYFFCTCIELQIVFEF